MEITDVRIKRVDSPGKLKAYVSVTFDECFVVHNMKIIGGQTGVFIAMPSRKTKAGEYKDIAHPITPAFRQRIQERILAEFSRQESREGTEEERGEEEERLRGARHALRPHLRYPEGGEAEHIEAAGLEEASRRGKEGGTRRGNPRTRPQEQGAGGEHRPRQGVQRIPARDRQDS